MDVDARLALEIVLVGLVPTFIVALVLLRWLGSSDPNSITQKLAMGCVIAGSVVAACTFTLAQRKIVDPWAAYAAGGILFAGIFLPLVYLGGKLLCLLGVAWIRGDTFLRTRLDDAGNSVANCPKCGQPIIVTFGPPGSTFYHCKNCDETATVQWKV